MASQIFVAGGTGYLGRNVIPVLLQRGHQIAVLSRSGSAGKVPAGCNEVAGNALDAESYKSRVAPADTFLHLVGVSHPSPAKAPLFRSIDLPAVHASIAAAQYAGIRHFVYLSVAQPASVMKAYIETRKEAEEAIRATGMNATFLRPWYVLGPGHRWAYSLLPFYWLLKRIPATRDSAYRLDLVSLPQMLNAIVEAIENPADGVRIVDTQKIKAAVVRV